MIKGYEIKVLDHGFVRFIDSFGSDERVVESARISYKSPSKGEEQDKKLLFFLYKHMHCSPFEQCNVTFNIKMPIFVMREFIRHRMFRCNEISGRYVQLPKKFYIPENWRLQDKKNKQGSTQNKGFNPDLDFDWGQGGGNATECLEHVCSHAYQAYESMLEAGVAREMARMILPVNLYTEVYVNCDVRNLMHFFTLRLAENAQWEIRQIAGAMFEIFKELYPWCAEAWERYKVKIEEVCV